jgi:hypothetical protein
MSIDTPDSKSNGTGNANNNPLLDIICSEDDAVRNQSLDLLCAEASFEELLEHCESLDAFWRQTDNLYHRVRALFFLSAIHRFHLPRYYTPSHSSHIPFSSYQQLLGRRFTEAIDTLRKTQQANGPCELISSALAKAYHDLGFQTLADQVRKSVRTVAGNQWMFRAGHPADHPLRFRQELLKRQSDAVSYPILHETTAVRMDFSHSGWSDIFFLGMDFPTGAKVINASVNLGVMGRDDHPSPPIECYLRVIDRPVLRLVSIDLKAAAEITTIAEVFDFARDYLGLLKAAMIAAGIVPPGMEGCGQSIESLLDRLVGPGLGIEIVSKVNDIPKGSRLAVSTNLLGSLIAMCMRATGQVSSLSGALDEADRRIIAARAILGEWIGGSGGGWQDSGGVWPGIKLIQGAAASEGDPEFGISRGRLLPKHTVFTDEEISGPTRKALQDSLVLVHGGMAQNVGPILEMVTEKYLLRSPAEWEARQEAIALLEQIKTSLQKGDIRAVGKATHKNFFGPLQKIIPWCTNLFTNSLVEQCEAKWGEQFWGFWMLGGMSGGGMGFIFDPSIKKEAAVWLQQTMLETKTQMQKRLPFAMSPVVYDFEINDRGTWGEIKLNGDCRMPDEYYALLVPGWLKQESHELSPLARQELEQLGSEYRNVGHSNAFQKLIESILPGRMSDDQRTETLDESLNRFGFDRKLHEQVQTDLKSGRFGLSQNRLPANTSIENVLSDDVIECRTGLDAKYRKLGEEAIAAGKVGVVTLAAGVGSRWTEGAGVVKALHPFCQLEGKHRSFLEVHLAKSRKVSAAAGKYFPHIVTTGYMTHDPIHEHLAAVDNYTYQGDVVLSPGRYVGLKMIPMVRDLQFAWEEMPQQVLDAQQQKVRDSFRNAMIRWARNSGQGSDYRDNTPMQCLHPVGHWYELPNMLRNGVLNKLLKTHPELEYLMLHNVDTLGANVQPDLLGLHISENKCLSFEVIERRLEDRGGGLARVNGQPRLVEGLSMPREEDEFRLTYYNSMTTWIDIDQLLGVFGLDRASLDDENKVEESVRALSHRMPTYITLKDVKKRWGNGQEDVFPVAQFEKLWSDMSAISEVDCSYLVVPLQRGQQLKEQAQLDSWLRDGTADYVNDLCEWS